MGKLSAVLKLSDCRIDTAPRICKSAKLNTMCLGAASP